MAPAADIAGGEGFWKYTAELVFGTALSAALALVIGAPLGVGIALFITHYAPRKLAAPLGYVIDLLAAIPSIVYGLWGVFVFAPALVPIYAWLADNLGWLPLFAGPVSSGRTMLTAGLVLAIMILPIISAISREVMATVPADQKEAALALGATRWEMIRLTVFPYSRSGMISAVMLGLGRALGETMAVAMVLSSSFVITLNLIGSSSPRTIAANVAANYKESGPAIQSVLIATGLVLFAFTFAVNFLARWAAGRGERRLAR